MTRTRFQEGMNRREFVRSSGVALLGLAAAGCASVKTAPESRGLVGSNIYGWGQYAQKENRKLDPAEVMKALSDLGYDYLEGFMNLSQPEENARFAEQLKQHGLRPVSIYTGPQLHEKAKAAGAVESVLKAAEVCRQAGYEVLSCNPAPIGREKTEEELATQVGALKQLAEGLGALGMKLGIHHHLPEMASKGREFHYVFQHTPRKVGWCYDVHWVWKGGLPVAEALKLYGDRIVTWHLRQSREGVWWEDLDTGDIDYSNVADFAARHRLAKRFTVELALEPGTKITRSVVENHRRSREFVRQVFKV